MADLKGLKVAIIATDMVEEVEMTEPREALENAGAKIHLLSLESGEIVSANHFDKSKTYKVDRVLSEVSPDDYDALLLPGGALNADFLRVDKDAQNFVKSFDKSNKPIAFICHAPWLLVSADIAGGRKMTSFHTIQD